MKRSCLIHVAAKEAHPLTVALVLLEPCEANNKKPQVLLPIIHFIVEGS